MSVGFLNLMDKFLKEKSKEFIGKKENGIS